MKTIYLPRIAVLLVFLTSGLQAQNNNRQIIDTLLDNGGYNLHFTIISGKGMPVLFETGDRDNTTIWNGIAQPVADITGAPIITYDRQGFGKSTKDPKGKGMEDEIKGLEAALMKLGFAGDIMLVSHSSGGFYNVVFAGRNAQRVKGIVFIDARVVCNLTDDMLKNMELNPPQMEIIKIMKTIPLLPASIPVIDITSEQNVMRDNNWKILHDVFVSESPNRKGILAYKTGHYVFLDNSRLTIDAIVSLYSDIQNSKNRVRIIENAYAYELNSANEDYRKKIEYQYSDKDLIDWSKSLLMNNKSNALEILKLNVNLYPESAAACDALAEAFLKTGNKEQAALQYKRSLEMNPDNREVRLMLDQIGLTVEVPGAILTSYVGEYELNGIPVSVTEDNNNIFLNFNNTRSVIYFTSDVDFFIVEYGNEFKFTRDSDGKVLGFLFRGMKAMKLK